MRRTHIVRWFLIAPALATILSAQPRRIEPISNARKLALVVGNDTYSGRPLANGVHDAQAMRTVLAEIGFDVDTQLNATMAQMEQAANRFVGRVRPGDVVLFYYSGHGIQVGDQNYLIPVDFDARTAVDAKYKSYAAARMQENLEAAGVSLQILILDACRDNPYRSVRGGGGGLAAMQAGKGTYIAFATAPGKTADDNARGSNGLFTGVLVETLREPGLSLDQVFNRVRREVSARRAEQVPWSTSSVVGEFYFRPAAGAPPVANVSSDVEVEYWRSIRDSNSADMFQGYLRRYPKGQFVEIAEARIRALSKTEQVRTPPAPTTVGPPADVKAFLGTWSEKWTDVKLTKNVHIDWVDNRPRVSKDDSTGKKGWTVSEEKFQDGVLTFHTRGGYSDWEFDYTLTFKDKGHLNLKVLRLHDKTTYTGELYR